MTKQKTELDFAWPETVEVYSCTGSYNFPSKLTEAIEFLQDKLALVPDKYKDSAKLEIDSHEDYDSTTENITISYTRPATQEEITKRFEQDKARRAADLAWAKRRVEELQ